MSSTYGYRISELRDLLSQVPAAASDRVHQAFVDLINRYGDLRQQAMDDLVDFVAKASASNSGTQSKWQSRVARARSEYNDLFGSAVRDVMLPPAHQLFWATMAQNEEKFFDGLARVGTPQLTDDLLKHQDELSKLIGALQDTWTFLLSKNQGILNDEMRAVQEVDKMVQDIISQFDTASSAALDYAGRAANAVRQHASSLKEKFRETMGRGADSAEAVAELLKQLILDQIKPDGMPSEVDDHAKVVLDRLKLMFDAAAQNAQKYRANVAVYKDLVSLQKGSVLTMFNKTRDDIALYLDTNNVAKARTWLDQAKGQLDDWASSLPTSGQVSDARAFCEEIARQLDGTWRITENLDAKFRSQFQGAFLRPISSETIETLAQRYQFREQLGRITDRDVVRKLEDTRDKLRDKTKEFEESLRYMDEPIDVLPSEVRDLANSRNRDFREYVSARMKGHMELLTPAIEDLKKLLTPSNIDADLGRQELENMLV
jgi:hypothetical protein